MRSVAKCLVVAFPILIAACTAGFSLPTGGPDWNEAVPIAEGELISGLVILEGKDVTHVVWEQNGAIHEKHHATGKDWAGGWVTGENIAAGRLETAAIDQSGTITLLYSNPATNALTARQYVAATRWGNEVPLGLYSAHSAQTYTDENGGVHLFVVASDATSNGAEGLHHLVQANGTLHQGLVLVTPPNDYFEAYTVTADASGGLTAVATTSAGNSSALKYAPGSGWSELGILPLRSVETATTAEGVYLWGTRWTGNNVETVLTRIDPGGNWNVLQQFPTDRFRMAAAPDGQILAVWSETTTPSAAHQHVPLTNFSTRYIHYTPGSGWGSRQLLATESPDVRALEFGPDGEAMLIFNFRGNVASSSFRSSHGWSAPMVLIPVSYGAPSLEFGFVRSGSAAMLYDDGGSDEVNARLFLPDTGWVQKKLIGYGLMPDFACLTGPGETALIYVNHDKRAVVSAWHLTDGGSTADWRESIMALVSYYTVWMTYDAGVEVPDYSPTVQHVTADGTLLFTVQTKNSATLYSVQLPDGCKPALPREHYLLDSSGVYNGWIAS